MAVDFKDFVFPVIRRAVFAGSLGSGEPLRRNIDYQSSARKSFVSDEPVPCPVCKEFTEAGANLGCKECVVRSIMES